MGAPSEGVPPTWTTADFEVGLVDPVTLVLPVSEALDTDSVSATSAFTVSNNTVTAVSLATANEVRLTLGTWVYPGDDTVTVSYTVPASNPIRDVAENNINAITTKAVTNNTHMKVERVENAGTAITIDADDYGTVIYCTAATAVTVTIPDTLSPVEGQTFSVVQWGAGQVQVTTSGTATIVSTSATTHKTRERYSSLQLIHAGSNTDDWHAFGDLEDN